MKSGGGDVPFRVDIAQASDLPEVRALAAAGEDVPRWPAEAWGTFVQGSAEVGRLAVLLVGRDRAERICGLLAGTVLAGCAELEFVWVCSGQRGLGLGRQLMERWFAWAAEGSAHEMFLEVRVSNRPAIALYRSLGFSEEGFRRGYYREPVEDATLMRVRLPRGG